MSKLVALAAAAVLFVAGSAHADEQSTTPEPTSTPTPGAKAEAPKKKMEVWYGYQTLTADGSALILGILSGASDSGGAQVGFAVASLVSYAVIPSVIHGVHGHPGRAAGDAAIRLGAPVVGALLGGFIGNAASSSNQSDFGDDFAGTIVGGLIGFAAGIAGASIIDATLLTYETVDVEPPPPDRKPQAITVLPSAGPTRNGFSAGLAGTF